MGIEHTNADVGAEADTFRESINAFETVVTKDVHDDGENKTTIEYVSGEGDAPFYKYRLTLELINTLSSAEYDELKNKPERQAAAE